MNRNQIICATVLATLFTSYAAAMDATKWIKKDETEKKSKLGGVKNLFKKKKDSKEKEKKKKETKSNKGIKHKHHKHSKQTEAVVQNVADMGTTSVYADMETSVETSVNVSSSSSSSLSSIQVTEGPRQFEGGPFEEHRVPPYFSRESTALATNQPVLEGSGNQSDLQYFKQDKLFCALQEVGAMGTSSSSSSSSFSLPSDDEAKEAESGNDLQMQAAAQATQRDIKNEASLSEASLSGEAKRFRDEAYSLLLKGDAKSFKTLLNAVKQRNDAEELLEKLLNDPKVPLLHLACMYLNESIVKTLLKAGANPNFKDSHDETAFHCISPTQSTEVKIDLFKNILELLLKKSTKSPKANLNEPGNRGDTPLMCSLYSQFLDQSEVIRALVGKGADLCTTNDNGDVLLHEIAPFSPLETIKTCIELGKSLVNSQNNDGNTPLHLVVKAYCKQMTKGWLADSEVTEIRSTMENLLNPKSHYKGVPDTEIVQRINCLINNGADIAIKNNAGKTPFDIACEAGFTYKQKQ